MNETPSAETARLFERMVLAAQETKYSEAFAIGEELMRAHDSFPILRFQHARNCIAVGEWKRALELFDSVRGEVGYGDPPIQSSVPIWSGENLHGKTLLLACEGGMGDAVCFSRFAASFRRLGARVILGGYEPIFSLLRTIEGVDTLVDRAVCEKTCFDFWVPALSAPRLLGIDLPQIGGAPYLSCPPNVELKWREIFKSLDSRLKIGICWQGNPGFLEDALRSIRGELFEAVIGMEEFCFVKIQVNEENNSFRHPNLIDLTRYVGDPADCAGFVSQLDLFITIDSGMAHVAGAMGIPTYLLNRIMGWFTFSINPDHDAPQKTPWYDSMRIIQQKKWGHWEAEMSRLKQLLRERQFPARSRTADRNPLYHPAKPAPADSPTTITETRYGPMVVAQNDYFVGRSLLLYGEYSQAEVGLFEAIVRPGDFAIDVGAQIGAHTVALCRIVGPSGAVLAIEPQPFLHQLVCANVALQNFANARVLNCALSDAPGRIRIPVMDYGQVGNFGGFELKGAYPDEKLTTEVDVRTLDEIAPERVDFIKIDVEGMELPVLKGASRTLARFRPILQVEDDRAAHSVELRSYLRSIGYRLMVHSPALFNPENFRKNSVNIFGDCRTWNLVAIPSEKAEVASRLHLSGIGNLTEVECSHPG